MIESFYGKETEKIWRGERSRHLPMAMQAVARRKLRMLHNARSLDDLRIPSGNRLEILQGDRKGQHSIRVNQQWRICFDWNGGKVIKVEIVDYH